MRHEVQGAADGVHEHPGELHLRVQRRPRLAHRQRRARRQGCNTPVNPTARSTVQQCTRRAGTRQSTLNVCLQCSSVPAYTYALAASYRQYWLVYHERNASQMHSFPTSVPVHTRRIDTMRTFPSSTWLYADIVAVLPVTALGDGMKCFQPPPPAGGGGGGAGGGVIVVIVSVFISIMVLVGGGFLVYRWQGLTLVYVSAQPEPFLPLTNRRQPAYPTISACVELKKWTNVSP